MNEKRITMIAEEAARLLRDNPSWTYRQAITKAKEALGYEEVEAMEKVN